MRKLKRDSACKALMLCAFFAMLTADKPQIMRANAAGSNAQANIPGVAKVTTRGTRAPFKKTRTLKAKAEPPAATPAPQKMASLPPVAAVRGWNPPLEVRKAIAERYLKKKCPSVFALEGMQSAADEKRVDDRFMAAKSAGAIIGVVKSEILSNPISRNMCPEVVADTQ